MRPTESISLVTCLDNMTLRRISEQDAGDTVASFGTKAGRCRRMRCSLFFQTQLMLDLLFL